MPALETLTATRVVASPAAVAAATWPPGAVVLPIAADEVLVLETEPGNVAIDDPHAIVTADGGWAGVWLDDASAQRLLEAECAWRLPDERPAFGQGMIAGLPVKVWRDGGRALFAVPVVFAQDFEARIAFLEGTP